MIDLIPGDQLDGVKLKLIKEPGVSRPRVMIDEPGLEPLKVEFPRKLREMHPLGTHFQADLRISQKTNKDGSLRDREGVLES